jgi:lysophospholipase L1-like esterase
VLAVGTNDMKNFHSARRFRREFGGLLYALKARFPRARVFWSPVVDMRQVPALPELLARILEIRAGVINRTGEELCRERGALAVTRLPVEDPASGFSRDGFHASEAGYEAWAAHLAPILLETLNSDGSARSAS